MSRRAAMAPPPLLSLVLMSKTFINFQLSIKLLLSHPFVDAPVYGSKDETEVAVAEV